MQFSLHSIFEGDHLALGGIHGYADFRVDPDRQDHHPKGGGVRHHRQCEGADSGQGGDSPRRAAPYFCGRAGGGRSHTLVLKYRGQKHSTFDPKTDRDDQHLHCD